MAGKKRLSNAAFVKKKTKVSVPRLRRALNIQVPEQKFFDTSAAMTPTASWAYQSFLIGIVQGAAVGTIPTANVRIGNKIFVKYIDVLVTMVPNMGAGQTSGAGCRSCIVHAKECNGTTLSMTDVFNGTSWTALRNTTKLPAYAVSRDHFTTFVPTAAIAANTVVAQAPIVLEKFRLRVNKQISYSGSTNTAADMLKDDYGIACVGNAATTCTMNVYWKVVFTDA